MSSTMRLIVAIAVVGGALSLAAAASAAPLRQTAVETPTVVVAAGDIASCENDGDAKTAALIARINPLAVLTLGDNAYPSGSAADFRDCYDPTWGAFRTTTFPSPGNHEYATAGAAGYFGYFGTRAPARYYSFNLGGWHFVSLNSEIPHGPLSAQVRWLRRNLAADRRVCELLYWHRPRFSGGRHGSDPGMQAFWRAAYELGVDVVLTGHDHNYQRFYRLDARGRLDPTYGVRQLVVGTGGKSHYWAGTIANRVVSQSRTHGVLKVTLRPRGYDLRFVPVEGSTWTDVVRRQTCHGAPR